MKKEEHKNNKENKGHKEYGVIDWSDIRPIFDNKFNPTILAQSLLFAVNSAQRQFLTGVKAKVDRRELSFEKFKDNPAIFFQGYGWRLAYQLGAIWPALQFSQKMKEGEMPSYAIIPAAAAIDAALGVNLELKSILATSPELAAKNQGANLFKTSGLIVFPFFVRNCFSWIAYSSDEKDISKRMIFGGMMNTIGGIADSFANVVIKNSDEVNSLSKALKVYAQSGRSMSFDALVKAAPLRGIGGMLATGLLSINSTKFVEGALKDLAKFISDGLAKNQNLEEKPSQVVLPKSINPIIDLKDLAKFSSDGLAKNQNLEEKPSQVVLPKSINSIIDHSKEVGRGD